MSKLSQTVDRILRFFRKNKYFAVVALAVAGVIALATFKDSIISLWDLVGLKKKASADVAEIEAIKKEVQGHRDAIQMIVRDANAIRDEMKPIAKSVEALRDGTEEAERKLATLKEEQRLMAFVNRAEAFDKEAFRHLQQLAAGTNEVAPLAQAMLSKVQRTLILDLADTTFLIPLEREGETDYRGPFTNDELAYRLLFSSPDGAINIVGNEKRTIFVPRLVQIAHNSKDLWTINRAAKALKEMGCVDFFPWDTGPLDRWWSENQSSYTNWPYGLHSQGIAAFSGCRYREALGNLTEVLKVDPGADRSRAMAIACALEVGDTNKVQALRSGFVQNGGRWDRWVQCRMVLETGTVHAATEAFADLAKAYPTFKDSAWISKGKHVLRKVDWTAYEEMMKPDEEETSNKEIQPTK
jgi:hypothetical protein